MKEPKQVILVRKDLKMNAGKLSAQVAHASVKALLDRTIGNFIHQQEAGKGSSVRYEVTNEERTWLEGSQTKVVLWVKDEKELRDFHQKAIEEKLTTCLVRDEGRTELEGYNYTTVAIGPADPDLIDELTGDLKLCKIWGAYNEKNINGGSTGSTANTHGVCQ